MCPLPSNIFGHKILLACVIYVHVSEVCLKVTTATDYFCHLKNPLQILWKMFLIPPLYILVNK